MEKKYANVMSLDEVLRELDKLNPGQKNAGRNEA